MRSPTSPAEEEKVEDNRLAKILFKVDLHSRACSCLITAVSQSGAQGLFGDARSLNIMRDAELYFCYVRNVYKNPRKA